MDKTTPLYEWHKAHGGKMVPFGGYLLPVQYTGVIAEHMAVRMKAGLFDVSHMGEIALSGPDALANLQRILTNDFADMYPGRVRYTLMCNEAGGVVDDLAVYMMEENRYMLVVNAANRDKDFAWISSNIRGDCQARDIGDALAQLALQGPLAPEILSKISKTIPQKYYTFIERSEAAGIPCIVSRTGYTGELGYELYCAPERAAELADAVMKAGEGSGLGPCGLGARDTLRLEASMPLYGHELTDETTPFEAGLQFVVKMDKPDFIGKAALVGKEQPARTRVGLKVTGKGIAREHMDIWRGGAQVGHTTSGTQCPFLAAAYAMAYVDAAASGLGTELEIDVRGRRVTAEVVAMPFYRR
jgi:aminomethyltransferase